MNKIRGPFKSRKMPAMAVGILSGAFAILALICLCVATTFQTSRFFQMPGKLLDYADGQFKTLIVLALAAFLAATLGVASAFRKHRFLSISFGIIMLPIWIVLLCVACVLGDLISSSESNTAPFCDGITFIDANVDSSESYNELLGDYMRELESTLIATSNKWMCSKQCPCNQDGEKP